MQNINYQPYMFKFENLKEFETIINFINLKQVDVIKKQTLQSYADGKIKKSVYNKIVKFIKKTESNGIRLLKPEYHFIILIYKYINELKAMVSENTPNSGTIEIVIETLEECIKDCGEFAEKIFPEYVIPYPED